MGKGKEEYTVMLKNFSYRRFFMMVFAIIIMGLGTCLFNLSLMGCSPAASLSIGVGKKLGLEIAGGMIVFNTMCFIVEILFGRHLIGLGTFVNWFGIGTTCEVWTSWLTSFINFPEGFVGRFLVMVLGVLVLSCSSSIYQCADQGISPYDSITHVVCNKLNLKFHWVRLVQDGIATIGAYFLGAIVSIGNVVSVFGMGPFVTFFTRTVAIPLCYGKSAFYSSEISDEIFKRIKGKSYKENCTIPREDLRYIKLLYFGFDRRIHVGELICNKLIADDLVDIFKELFERKYEIEKVCLIDEYDADDEKSMSDNNSSAFNFRYISHTKTISNHGLGLAIDINPKYNPYIFYNNGMEIVEPSNSLEYVDRTKRFEHKINENDLCYKLFIKHGFEWGGSWLDSKDYQHFEKVN